MSIGEFAKEIEKMEDRYLFKAKRADNGEWITGYYTKSIVNGSVFGYIRESIFGTDIKIMLNTLCQYTGKRDKHNNLIFENDLMDGFIYPYLSGLDSEHDYFAEVCWCDDITGFGICTHKYKNSDVRGSADGDVDLIEDFDSSKWEVIGNIFDNPELLESEE